MIKAVLRNNGELASCRETILYTDQRYLQQAAALDCLRDEGH